MMALSALMGRRMTLLPFLRLTMMTSGDALPSDCCRTQMKWSDSSVQELKPMEDCCGTVSVHDRPAAGLRQQTDLHTD